MHSSVHKIIHASIKNAKNIIHIKVKIEHFWKTIFEKKCAGNRFLHMGTRLPKSWKNMPLEICMGIPGSPSWEPVPLCKNSTFFNVGSAGTGFSQEGTGFPRTSMKNTFIFWADFSWYLYIEACQLFIWLRMFVKVF